MYNVRKIYLNKTKNKSQISEIVLKRCGKLLSELRFTEVESSTSHANQPNLDILAATMRLYSCYAP